MTLFRVIPAAASFTTGLATTFIIVVAALTISNVNSGGYQDESIRQLQVATHQKEQIIVVLDAQAMDIQNRIIIAYNETTQINVTLNGQLDFLNNYTCDQIERMNNITPGCPGDITIRGVGNITVDPDVNGIFVNGTILEQQLLDDQTLIDFISNNLALTDTNLATLNMEAIKTINNVTVDANGNINLVGQCGVDIYVSNVTNNVIIDTCAIQNNGTALVVFLNNTYFSIQNQTDNINATLISISQLLVQLQMQLDALKPLRVTNFNGTTPIDNNMALTAGPGIEMQNNLGSGVVGVRNAGIVSVNNLNNNGNVNLVAGNGITITSVDQKVNISNTFADIFERPCTVASTTTTLGPTLYTDGEGTTQWDGFTPNTKTYPECPEVFVGVNFVQPEGLWTLTFLATISGGLVTPPCTFCGFSLSYGVRDLVTNERNWLTSYYPGLNAGFSSFGAFSQSFMVGELTMNGYTTPPGRMFDFRAYFSRSNPAEQLSWTVVSTVRATRIA